MNARSRLAVRRVLCHLVAVLLAASGAGADEPPADDLPGVAVDLHAVPQLQRTIHGTFHDPTADDLINSVRAQTGVNLSLDASVIRERRLQRDTQFRVPAWAVMEQVASNRYVRGQWRKLGDEYRLFASYKGPLPQLPAPPPPQPIVNAVRDNTAIQFDPGPELSTTSRWTTGRLTAMLAGCLALVAVSVWLLWRQRRRQPTPPASPPSTQARLRRAALPPDARG